MGNQKHKWKSEEEEALIAGVAKHGTGRWKNILNDPEFAPFLTQRSNIDLKDKWRNMGVNTAAQGSRIPRGKTITVSPAADDTIDDPSKSPQDGKSVPRYNAMIFEALSGIKDSNRSDIGAIFSFIEQRHEVPQNFRRQLSSKLRRLVLQGKLEKVQNCYKIKDSALGAKTPTPRQKDIKDSALGAKRPTPKQKDIKDSALGAKTPTPKQKDTRPRPSQNSGIIISGETLEDAAMTAAYKIAEAENKSCVAAEAVKEAERVSKMAEDADSLLQLMKEIYEQCSRGEVVHLA